jgi:hypothetical protein
MMCRGSSTSWIGCWRRTAFSIDEEFDAPPGVIEELIAERKIQAIKAKYAVEELERRLDAGS